MYCKRCRGTGRVRAGVEVRHAVESGCRQFLPSAPGKIPTVRITYKNCETCGGTGRGKMKVKT